MGNYPVTYIYGGHKEYSKQQSDIPLPEELTHRIIHIQYNCGEMHVPYWVQPVWITAFQVHHIEGKR